MIQKDDYIFANALGWVRFPFICQYSGTMSLSGLVLSPANNKDSFLIQIENGDPKATLRVS